MEGEKDLGGIGVRVLFCCLIATRLWKNAINPRNDEKVKVFFPILGCCGLVMEN